MSRKKTVPKDPLVQMTHSYPNEEEVFGLPSPHNPNRNDSVQISISAGALRARELKAVQMNRPQVVKPPKKFEDWDTVSIRNTKVIKDFGTSNGVVVGSEWGGTHRDVLKDEWIYYITLEGNPGRWAIVLESELGGIS